MSQRFWKLSKGRHRRKERKYISGDFCPYGLQASGYHMHKKNITNQSPSSHWCWDRWWQTWPCWPPAPSARGRPDGVWWTGSRPGGTCAGVVAHSSPPAKE